MVLLVLLFLESLNNKASSKQQTNQGSTVLPGRRPKVQVTPSKKGGWFPPLPKKFLVHTDSVTKHSVKTMNNRWVGPPLPGGDTRTSGPLPGKNAEPREGGTHPPFFGGVTRTLGPLLAKLWN